MPAKKSSKGAKKSAKLVVESPTKEEVVAATEIIYDILQEKGIQACAIGSTAMACDTTRPCARNPQSIDFLTFNKPYNQLVLNDVLVKSRPDLFITRPQTGHNSYLPPLLLYKVAEWKKECRVFFLPIWTGHSKANIPSLSFKEVEPSGKSTVPIPPLPYQLWLQLHGWTWNSNLLRRNLEFEQRARTKRSNYALDISSLLPLTVKQKGHFDWLSDEFHQRIVGDALEFTRVHPTSAKGWRALGLEVQRKPSETTQSSGSQSDLKPNTRGTRPVHDNLSGLETARAPQQGQLKKQSENKRPALGFVEGKKGPQMAQLLQEQDDLHIGD